MIKFVKKTNILKFTREVKTAILVILAILLFIWGYNFLKGRELLTDYKIYYVEYDNVEGLAKSASVTLNGLVIGKINTISIIEETGKLLVELQIKTDFPISKSSVASIYEPGFIAGKQIAIYPNYKDTDLAVEGQKFIGTTKLGLTASISEKLLPLQNKLDKLLVNADKLVTGINNVLDKKGQENLKVSLFELTKTLEQFHKASSSLNIILDENKLKINSVVSNFNKISSNFSKISDSLTKVDLGKTAKNLEKTIVNVDKIISELQAGKGSMGKLLNDDSFYKNLTKTTNELELLLQDIRLHPTRYVNVSLFGKKDKPYIGIITDTVSKVKN